MQILVNTLVLGIMYILASLGFAFIFNMLGTINLAHGALYMVGAYLCYYLCASLGMNNWLAMVVAAVVLAAVGRLLYGRLSGPVRQHGRHHEPAYSDARHACRCRLHERHHYHRRCYGLP